MVVLSGYLVAMLLLNNQLKYTKGMDGLHTLVLRVLPPKFFERFVLLDARLYRLEGGGPKRVGLYCCWS